MKEVTRKRKQKGLIIPKFRQTEEMKRCDENHHCIMRVKYPACGIRKHGDGFKCHICDQEFKVNPDAKGLSEFLNNSNQVDLERLELRVRIDMERKKKSDIKKGMEDWRPKIQ